MKKSSYILFSGIVLSLFANTSIAKKPAPPSDMIDYDIVSFTCPATVSSTELVELRVEVVNVGPADPGVVLQAREEDALLGPNLVVNEVVYDPIEKGRRQKPTEYVYYVSPTYLQSYIQWSVNLYDDNHVDDLDWAFCSTQILWN